MAGLSDWAESAILNALLRGTNLTAPLTSSLRLALFTSDPTDAGTANEVPSGTWYSRQPTGSWNAPAPAGNAQQCTNAASITFSAVTVSAVTITHVGIFDAATAGNMLFSAPLQSSKTLQVGDVLSFAPGTLIASLD
jgi:hypothetical protein